MKHDWELDEDGDIDTVAMAVDYHNGPSCQVCRMSYCEHCEPNWFELDDCPGAEAIEAEREQRRAERRERVAKAIAEADGSDGRCFLSDQQWHIDDRAGYFALADAAIEAMRET